MMFRILKSAIALSAVLALAACNSVTAPVVDSQEENDDAQSAERDSKRNDHEFIEVGDEFAPLPDDGGGTGNRYGDQQEERDSADRGKRVGQEVIAIGDEFTPMPDDGGGTGNRYGDQEPQQRESAYRRSNRNTHEWTPAEGEGTGGPGSGVAPIIDDPQPPRVVRRARGQEVAPVR